MVSQLGDLETHDAMNKNYVVYSSQKKDPEETFVRFSGDM